MIINDEIRDEKLQYDINGLIKFVNMNILPVKIYYHLINSK